LAHMDDAIHVKLILHMLEQIKSENGRVVQVLAMAEPHPRDKSEEMDLP
jgi:hypothetical protein